MTDRLSLLRQAYTGVRQLHDKATQVSETLAKAGDDVGSCEMTDDAQRYLKFALELEEIIDVLGKPQK
jgi:hypothetical protein